MVTNKGILTNEFGYEVDYEIHFVLAKIEASENE